MLVFNMKFLGLASIWIVGSEAVKCYTPNGDDRNEQLGYQEGEDYVPCNASGGHSMCCAFGSLRIAGNSADTCLENGLCQNGDVIWRESCTDRTWQDPACLKLFVNGTGYGSDPIVYDGDTPITDVTVTKCDNGSYCSGTGNRRCCELGQGYFLDANGEQTTVNPAVSSSAISSTTSTTSATSSPSSTSSTVSTAQSTTTSTGSSSSANGAQLSESSGGGGLSTGAKAGIGAGIGVAAAIGLVVLGIWLMKRRRRQNHDTPESSMIASPPGHATRTSATSELQISGHGRDYRGPFHTAELESPSPTVQDSSNKSSSGIGTR